MGDDSEDSGHIPRRIDFADAASGDEEERMPKGTGRPKYARDILLLRVTPRRFSSYVTDDGLVVPRETIDRPKVGTRPTSYAGI